MRDVSVIEIDLSAIRHNLTVVRRIVGSECGLCPMLKADAYGLGGPQIARCLDAAGADLFAVYSIEEAAALLEAGVRAPSLVLMPVRRIDPNPSLYRALSDGRIHLTIHDQTHLADVIAVTEKLGLVSLPVHVEVDTGMSRGGCDVEEASRLLRLISVSPRLDLVGVYTHFARASSDVTFTNRQLQTFDTVAAAHPDLFGSDLLVHAANTAATLRHRRYHATMVRFGLAWVGYGAECFDRLRAPRDSRDLRPAVAWRSEIVQVKTIDAGTPVGYGGRWEAPRETTLGLVPVGYAHGYPSTLAGHSSEPPRAKVRVLGRDGAALGEGFAPVVGAINMDQITVDLTDLCGAGFGPRAGIGAAVEVITPDRRAPNHLPTLARAAGVPPHELLCRLNPRVRREYVAERRPEVRVREVKSLVAG